MNVHSTPSAQSFKEGGAVRADFVPADDYLSTEFLDLEARYLWPRAWQMACREEEIPRVGDYYTYDILEESITVVRTGADEIKAYYNSCPHRGRRLTGGCGHTMRLHCKYHGWQWDLHGKNTQIIDRDDWGEKLSDEDVALVPVKVGRWGGWIYINMDPDSESLEEALSPAKAFLDPYDLGGLRYHWRKSTILPCNWKVALEAFNEGYHVQTTHRQMLEYMDDVTVSFAHGRHAMFAYWDALPSGMRSRRIGGPESDDIRPGLLMYMEDMARTLNAGSSVQTVHAARRVMQEVAPGTPPMEVLMKFGQFIYENAVSKGAAFPPITPEQLRAGGIDWHLFPNQVMLQGPTGLLGYRARPNGRNPDSCIWDVYSLQRYGTEETPPTVELEFNADITDEAFWGKILIQDYQNMEDVQMGMKSRGFRGARPSPKQEIGVSNFHRALHEFINQGMQA